MKTVSRCASCTVAVWIIRFTCCCCDVYESTGSTARWTDRRRRGVRVLASRPLAMLRVALYPMLVGALLSPIGLVVTALAGVALVVWKYWQPIAGSGWRGGRIQSGTSVLHSKTA